MKRKDEINHPEHYNTSEIEPIEVIRDWRLGFNLGCLVKYIARHPYKGTPLKDLKKAKWYLDDEISFLKSRNEVNRLMNNTSDIKSIADLKIKPIEVIKDWKLSFSLGFAMMHVACYRCKGTPLKDLKDAKQHLDDEINFLESIQKKNSKGKRIHGN